MTWEAAHAFLSEAGSPSDVETICSAITRLGKPFDAMQMKRAAPLVYKYLHHEHFLVRYQAIWFLGSWGALPEYLSQVIDSARSDEEIDNRAFAARCAGQILKSQHDSNAAKALFQMATDEAEEPNVRE